MDLSKRFETNLAVLVRPNEEGAYTGHLEWDMSGVLQLRKSSDQGISLGIRFPPEP
jgi:hypothetical protein